MILLTGFYQDADAARRAELLECLRRNVASPGFEQIHVLIEEPPERCGLLAAEPVFAAAKVRLIPHGRRVTYRDLFTHAGRRLSGRCVVVANADIFFDDTLALLDGFNLTGRLLCLSRWDVQPDGSARFFDRPDSQDAWIFEAPIRDFCCDFHLGMPGCDNRLAWEAERAGLVVSNPSRSVRAHHLHGSGVRRYGGEPPPPGEFRFLPPVFLETPYPSARGPAPEVPRAAVAFRETMGYTVDRLEVGVSSHNNQSRPFESIPAPLEGLPFTQVVAYATSPIEVTFRTAGKVYVLLGDDWDDSRIAARWLNEAGFRESLPSVRTRHGTGFEVWSLVGTVGARFVVPTQVMVAAEQLTRAAGDPAEPVGPPADARGAEPVFALTSLPVGPERAPRIHECIRSWQRAGLRVRAFNHPQEIAALPAVEGVEFVPVAETTRAHFGRDFVPIHTMLDWAAGRDVPALLINADIELRMNAWELNRIRLLSGDGLCYFVRYDHDGAGPAEREPYGIDAFLFHGRDVARFPRSLLSMGRPFWDYWVPHTFAARDRPIYSVEFPAAFHQRHTREWSEDDWHRCALEFTRCAGARECDGSFQGCRAMSLRVRHDLDRKARSLTRDPPGIRDWVQHAFGGGGAPKLFLELGAHRGSDTEWMARLPNVTVHAFEPDPRNHPPPLPNVTVHRAAVADRDGTGTLFLSQHGESGQEWTYSSSVKRPKNHLRRYGVTFGGGVEVELVALDTFSRRHGLGVIDFIWADIQGAEGEMIRGGRWTLERTRYLFTEYSDDELYEDQMPLHELLRMLPGFRVIELWPEDVLLENRNMMPDPGGVQR